MTEALTHTTAAPSEDTAAAMQPLESSAAPVPADVPLSPGDVEAAVHAIADRSRHAARRMAMANRAWKDRALRAVGTALQENTESILTANAMDVAAGKANGTSAAMLDRLTLTETRIAGLVAALENLANLPDPVGNVVRGQTLPNGLRLRQVNVPMGVVAAIYEARPNVTVDIAGLALKSGNAVILRGGSAAQATNEVLVRVLREALDWKQVNVQ
jgi:glutamate-5-semialdehyde dehydrogenase